MVMGNGVAARLEEMLYLMKFIICKIPIYGKAPSWVFPGSQPLSAFHLETSTSILCSFITSTHAKISSKIQTVSTKNAPPALKVYSQALIANGFVYCSGTRIRDGNLSQGQLAVDTYICAGRSPILFFFEPAFSIQQLCRCLNCDDAT